MQGRAIFEAAVRARKRGFDVQAEIMIPLVATAKEYEYQAAILREMARQVLGVMGFDIPYKLGTMIELPRAALVAGEIAAQAEFFSFGTNDLTQTTLFGLPTEKLLDVAVTTTIFDGRVVYSRDGRTSN